MEFEAQVNTHFHELAINAQSPLTVEQFESLEKAKLFVNWCLNGSYDDPGIERWWERPREQLDGRTPQDTWVENPECVIGLAGWLVNHNLEG